MYCRICGKEIEKNAKFCEHCGASLQLEITNSKNSVIKEILDDGKKIIKGAFSKQPNSIVEIAKHTNSYIGIVLIFITIVLFGTVSCFNVVRIIKQISDGFFSYISTFLINLLENSYINKLIESIEDNVLNEQYIFSKLTASFFIIAIVIIATIITAICIISRTRKTPIKSLNMVCNHVGISCVPVIISLILNLILGFFIPAITIMNLIIGLLLGMVILYEGIKEIFKADKPIKEMGFLILLTVLLGVVIGIFAFSISVNNLCNSIEGSITAGVNDMLNNMFKDALRDLF